MMWLAALALLFGGSDSCFERFDLECAVVLAVTGSGWLVGHLSLADDSPDLTTHCHLTPSTGQMSGVFVRQSPDFDAPVIGDVALDEYRVVTAISDTWVQTITRSGGAGFVAARMVALVGPCGDVPRFEVSP